MKIAIIIAAGTLMSSIAASAQDVASKPDRPEFAEERAFVSSTADAFRTRSVSERKKKARIKAARLKYKRTKAARIKKARLKHKRIKMHRIKTARLKKTTRR